MTTRKIVDLLRSQGHNVRTYERKGGGIRITGIDNVSFRGSKGNAYARAISGERLSEAQIRHTTKITENRRVTKTSPLGEVKVIKKGTWGNVKKVDSVSQDVKKQIKKVQGQFRRAGAKGKPTLSNFRYMSQKYGEKEALNKLEQASLYIQGYAYKENIRALADRLETYANEFDEFKPAYNKLLDLMNGSGLMKDSDLMKIREMLYDLNTMLNMDVYDDEYIYETASDIEALIR